MKGKIIKGIAGFYYVHVGGRGIYECKAKGIFRNRKIKPLVGDDVLLASERGCPLLFVGDDFSRTDLLSVL